VVSTWQRYPHAGRWRKKASVRETPAERTGG